MPENSAVSSKNAAPQFLVQGVVSDRARRPAGSMTVTAFDQDLRTRQQLGRSRTNANGEFRIDYTSVQFKRAEQGGADLVLEVRSQADELLHTTATHFHAPPKLTIDITLASRGGEAELPGLEGAHRHPRGDARRGTRVGGRTRRPDRGARALLHRDPGPDVRPGGLQRPP